MSLSADPRYRSVHLTWRNYDAAGGETVRWWAKPSGGAWSIVQTMPVALEEQAADWDTALPLTAYEIALQFVNGTVATVGYEGDPDDWTAATAAQSKGTVTTTSADVSGLTGTFVSASQPAALSWSSAQQDVPYLLEKSLDSGVTWSTVVSGLVATSYPYTVPAAELDTTVLFRVTAQRGAITGPSTTGSVLMTLVVAAPVLNTATFVALTASLSLAWSAAANATAYRVEKSADGGATWTAVGSYTTLAVTLQITQTEINKVMEYRVFGTNGAISSVASNVRAVLTTMAVTAPTMVSAQQHAPGDFNADVVWTLGTGDIQSYLIEACKVGDVWHGFAVLLPSATSGSVALGLLYGPSIYDHGFPWTGRARVVARSYGGWVTAVSGYLDFPMVNA